MLTKNIVNEINYTRILDISTLIKQGNNAKY